MANITLTQIIALRINAPPISPHDSAIIPPNHGKGNIY